MDMCQCHIAGSNCNRELKLSHFLVVDMSIIDAKFEVFSSKHSGVAKLHPVLCIYAIICIDMCQCHFAGPNCNRELKLSHFLLDDMSIITAKFEVYSSKHSGVAKLHPLLCIDASICMDMDMCQCHASRPNCNREMKLSHFLLVAMAMITAKLEVYSPMHSGVPKLQPSALHICHHLH